MQTKYIFITGGVVSGLGKGIAAASIGALLEARGLTVSLMKLDPYINVDAGTMNPFQHGEVFVTVDGAETDLDLGHYERYTNAVLTRKHNRTTGQIYDTVIRKERAGDYLGATVQVIPHVIDEIKNTIIFSSYAELITSNKIDAVYIALPNSMHFKWAKFALDNNIHVICEKPLTCNLIETQILVELAIKNNLVLMETFQFRFHSQFLKILEIIRNNKIGEIRSLKANFSFPPFVDKNNIRY